MDYNAFIDRLNQAPLPVVIDLWATWCMPCRMIEPALHRLDEKYADQVEVWKINADESQDLLRRLGVSGIPTLIAFRQGREVSRLIGAQPQPSLERLFKAALGEQDQQKIGLAASDRFIRFLAGLILITLGWMVSHSLLLIAIGGIVLFSAVYDRCPIYQTVAPRIKTAIRTLLIKLIPSA